VSSRKDPEVSVERSISNATRRQEANGIQKMNWDSTQARPGDQGRLWAQRHTFSELYFSPSNGFKHVQNPASSTMLDCPGQKKASTCPGGRKGQTRSDPILGKERHLVSLSMNVPSIQLRRVPATALPTFNCAVNLRMMPKTGKIIMCIIVSTLSPRLSHNLFFHTGV
jgi:hypothetical protein